MNTTRKGALLSKLPDTLFQEVLIDRMNHFPHRQHASKPLQFHCRVLCKSVHSYRTDDVILGTVDRPPTGRSHPGTAPSRSHINAFIRLIYTTSLRVYRLLRSFSGRFFLVLPRPGDGLVQGVLQGGRGKRGFIFSIR
jgi:hypothetical protein